GPGSSCRRPLQAQVALKSASPVPAPASEQAISVGSAPAQLPPAFVGSNPSPASTLLTFCYPVACTDPGPAGEQPLRAPRLPPRGLSRPGSCPTVATRGQVPACLPQGSLNRPSSSHTMAIFCPTHASPGPPRGVRSCLTLACLDQGPPSVSSCLTLASLGQGPPSCWPVKAQLMPLMAYVLPHASLLGPSSCLSWPLQAKPLPVGSL
ncbi:hypothetical protein EGM_20577, partial [Macaca fascicularis]